MFVTSWPTSSSVPPRATAAAALAWIGGALLSGNVEIRDEHEVEGLPLWLVLGEVGFHPVDVDAGGRGALAGLTESLGREVDGGDAPPSLGEPHRMTAVAAAEVERASRCEAVEGIQHDGARLAVRVEQLVRPAAIPVAGVHALSALPYGDPLDHDRLRRLLGGGVAERFDPLDGLVALRHLADDRVLGRQGSILGRDDEELAAARSRRLGLASWPSPRRRAYTRPRKAARRRSSSPARRRPCRSGRRPGSRSRARRGGRSCCRRSRRSRARRAKRPCRAPAPGRA